MLSTRRLDGIVILATDDGAQSLAPLGRHIVYTPGKMEFLERLNAEVCEFDSIDAIVEHAYDTDSSAARESVFQSYECSTEQGPDIFASTTTQWGIITPEGSRCIYSPSIEWEFVPEHARSFFGDISASARELNDALHSSLQSNGYAALIPLLKEYCADDCDISDVLEIKQKSVPARDPPPPRIIAPPARDSQSKAEIMIHYQALGAAGMSECRAKSEILATLSRRSGLQLIPFRYISACYAVCEARDLDSILQRLHASLDPAFVWAAPIRRVPRTILEPPVMPVRATTLPNLEQINAPAAWESTRGEGVRIGIIDTGIDYTHPELNGRFDPRKIGYDFINDDHDPADGHGHGTHVAGIIAGESIGVAPEVTLYSLRALNEDGMGSEVSIIRAIEWGMEEGLDILNMSLGAPQSTYAEEEAVRLAAKFGTLIVAAAGNAGEEEYDYPASYPEAVSVAAVDCENRHAEFSNINDRIAVCAPGVDILSSWPGGGYMVLSGTSMATPHVSGVAALALSFNRLAPPSLKELLMSTAQRLGDDVYDHLYFGAGLVRADAVVNARHQHL